MLFTTVVVVCVYTVSTSCTMGRLFLLVLAASSHLLVSGNANCNVGTVKCTCPNGGCIRSALSGQWLLQLGQPSPCTGTITQVDYQLYSNSSVEYEAQIVIAVWRPAEPGVYDRISDLVNITIKNKEGPFSLNLRPFSSNLSHNVNELNITMNDVLGVYLPRSGEASVLGECNTEAASYLCALQAPVSAKEIHCNRSRTSTTTYYPLIQGVIVPSRTDPFLEKVFLVIIGFGALISLVLLTSLCLIINYCWSIRKKHQIPHQRSITSAKEPFLAEDIFENSTSFMSMDTTQKCDEVHYSDIYFQSRRRVNKNQNEDSAELYSVVGPSYPYENDTDRNRTSFEVLIEHGYESERDSTSLETLTEHGYECMVDESFATQGHIYQTLLDVQDYEAPVSPYCSPSLKEDQLYEQLASISVKMIDQRDIEITGLIGQGEFGSVHKGIWHQVVDDVKVAVKTPKTGTAIKNAEKIKLLQETMIMGQFCHPNIVALHGLVLTPQKPMMILELVNCGDLKNYFRLLRKRANVLQSNQLPLLLLKFCLDICFGMKYLSRMGFIHRDLAARNVLVDDGTTCKIADFGLSREIDDYYYTASAGAKIPIMWTAPEAVTHRKYSTASDVWSFGCVMYEIWSLGHKPFEGISSVKALEKLTQGIRLSPPPGCPEPIYELMIKCWHPDKHYRPSFHKLAGRLMSLRTQEMLSVPLTIFSLHSQARNIGAALQAGRELYPTLQKSYLDYQ